LSASATEMALHLPGRSKVVPGALRGFVSSDAFRRGVNTVPVKQIFLFGSYANGTPQTDSDLDIHVVISENADIREIDAMRLIHKAIGTKN